MNKTNIVDIIQNMSLSQLQQLINSTSYECEITGMEARDRNESDAKKNRYIFDCSSYESNHKDTIVILVIDAVGDIELDIV